MFGKNDTKGLLFHDALCLQQFQLQFCCFGSEPTDFPNMGAILSQIQDIHVLHTEHQQYQEVEVGNLATVQTCAMCHLKAFYMVRLHPSGIWAPSKRSGFTEMLNDLETSYLVNLLWNLFLSYCSCLHQPKCGIFSPKTHVFHMLAVIQRQYRQVMHIF